MTITGNIPYKTEPVTMTPNQIVNGVAVPTDSLLPLTASNSQQVLESDSPLQWKRKIYGRSNQWTKTLKSMPALSRQSEAQAPVDSSTTETRSTR